MEEIRLGHVSDLKGGPPLYTGIGEDKNGLTIYRCARGTSSVEGSVHMNIVRKFASYNAGPRLTNMALCDYRLHHNIDVGSKNRYGKIHTGHYSPWISQAINTLRIEVGHSPVDAYFSNRVGNAFEYMQTKETFGIVSVPRSVTQEFDIEPATDEPADVTQIPLHIRQRSHLRELIQISTLPTSTLKAIGYSASEYLYVYLAQCQKTSLAVTAVHTDEEIKLYKSGCYGLLVKIFLFWFSFSLRVS